MKKCPNCSKAYDDSWKVCLNCDISLLEDISEEINEATGEKLIGIINELERTMWEAAGNTNIVITGGHESIERALSEAEPIIQEITPEFAKHCLDATNLFWIMLWTQANLMHIDCAIASEIQHAEKHGKSCSVLLKMFPFMHSMVDDIDNPEGWIKQFERSNNRKVRDLAPKVAHYLHEYHKALYSTENSIKNAIKFEEESKADK